MAMINYVTEIRFGAGSAAELAQVCQALGFKKPLFITDKGVVAAGELVISLADIELVYVGLNLTVASVETARQLKLTIAASPAQR